MERKKQGQKPDKYGKIHFGEDKKLWIDIIGQNTIFPKDTRKASNATVRRVSKGKKPKKGIDLQHYCDDFFKMLENNCIVSPLVMTSLNLSLERFIYDFSIYAKSNKILNKSKNEIALYLLYTYAFHHIDSPENDPFNLIDFKVSEKDMFVFLTDSYKKIFDEIRPIIKTESFYEEIFNEIEKSKLEINLNINHWKNGKKAKWQTLVPILDYLHKQKHDVFVYRLIGLYLRENAQKVFAPILGVSEKEMKKIIEEKIPEMIKEKKRPENIPSNLYFNEYWFLNQRYRIVKCLEFQNNMEVKKANEIIKYLTLNYSCSSEEKFLLCWLQTRDIVFNKHYDLKSHEEPILNGYKIAFNEILDETGKSSFKTQFLTEIILINDFFYRYPNRRKKAIEDYYEYGFILGTFDADKLKIHDILKEFRNTDIRKALVDIHHKLCDIKLEFHTLVL